MAVWEFALAYLAAFLLLQFVVYRYLKPGDDDDTSAAPAGGSPVDTARAEERSDLPGDVDVDVASLPERPPADDGPATRSCPSCGAENDAVGTFTHCRRCAEPL